MATPAATGSGRVRLVLVGGFLGAGKTTLLAESARRLSRKGHTVGLITNDQAPALVDTALLAQSGSEVREVAGSCFCCNFDGFKRAVDSLEESGADCILAEPVGSCTDLAATIVQPLKRMYPELSIAPLSVMVDPQRARAVLKEKDPLLHADAAYILLTQMEEADHILLNKCDIVPADERNALVAFLKEAYPRSHVSAISAQNGDGIEEWLGDVLSDAQAGTTIAAVDYDRYARGEAVLGWLNAVVSLRWTGSLEAGWGPFLRDLMTQVHEALRAKGCEIGHIKMLIDTPSGRIVSNLTALNGAIDLRAEGAASRLTATLTVNARAQVSPGDLEEMLRRALKTACYARAAHTVTAFHCISPGRPVPTYRFDSAVA